MISCDFIVKIKKSKVKEGITPYAHIQMNDAIMFIQFNRFRKIHKRL